MKPRAETKLAWAMPRQGKGRMKSNVFMKPRAETKLAWAMPRQGKGRMKSNVYYMHIVYLSLGSNMGDRRQLLERAIAEINKQVGRVVRQSAFYETEPWGFESENLFLNAAVCVETALTPRQLLQVTQKIERQLGRTRKTRHDQIPSLTGEARRGLQYVDRPIDIDILLYDDLTINEPDLQIPHPLMHERDFVMMPLREILFTYP